MLYGPNVDDDRNVTESEGKIAGEEFLAFAGDPSPGRENVRLMVQVPSLSTRTTRHRDRAVFGLARNLRRDCHFRRMGLKRGCAVAYTDKGTGTGAHDLTSNVVNLITGVTAGADQAGKDSIFTAGISDQERHEFNVETPGRFAFKHAHSQQNPEKDWDRNVLQSIRFAFSS